MMKALALAALAGAPLVASAGPAGAVKGDYVEVRTAEVFTGGCVMGSEGETVGREAILAWRITEGRFNGVRLDGLSVVAAIAGDRNLGMHEMGGEAPTVIRAAVTVDARADADQRRALVELARQMSNGLVRDLVAVEAAPISFSRSADAIAVKAPGVELVVGTTLVHKPGCGAMQWFMPFADLDEAALGMTRTHTFSGDGLGIKWSDPDKKSAFYGTFSLATMEGYKTP